MEKLLDLLQQNARMTNAQLAAMLGTSEDAVAVEIQRLEDAGIIRGYHVVLSNAMTENGKVTAYIELKVTPQRDCGFDDLAKTVMHFDEVEDVFLMSGAYDLGVTVTGESLQQIAQFVAQRLSTIDGVISTATHFVLRRYKEKGILIDGEDPDERGVLSL